MRISKHILSDFLPKDKKQWTVFIWCLFISSLLWTLLKFSEEREEEVLIEVEFINPPKNQLLVGKEIARFPVNIKAQGFDLILKGFASDYPLVKIDLSKTSFFKKGDVNIYYWLPKKNEAQISKAFGAYVTRMLFPIDTVKLAFSPLATKELFTKFKFSVANNKEYFSFGKAITFPKLVKVRGAKSVLNNVDTIYTELIKLESLESNLENDYAIKRTPGIDSLFTDSIRVFIGVESIKKFTFEVPIEIRNKPDSLEVKLFPNEVKISFVCGTNKFLETSPRSFQPYIDFKDIDASFKKISISLDKQPNQVKEVKVEPYSVEYILRTASLK